MQGNALSLHTPKPILTITSKNQKHPVNCDFAIREKILFHLLLGHINRLLSNMPIVFMPILNGRNDYTIILSATRMNSAKLQTTSNPMWTIGTTINFIRKKNLAVLRQGFFVITKQLSIFSSCSVLLLKWIHALMCRP